LKKAISILFLISCLLSTPSLITREISVKASPVILTVDPITIIVPDNYTTIQGAINNASSGDTIFVHIGTYYEHVVINKTITLVGEDNNFTIIDGNKTDNVIHIRANNVTVKGFTIQNSGRYVYSGILVDHSTGNVIINNKVRYNYEGISLLYSSGNVVCDNTILSNDDGVYLYSSSSNVVSGNILLHNEFNGISLYYSSSNVVRGNTILSSNYYGIYLAFLSNNNTIYHNNFNNTDQAWSESTNIWNFGDEGNYWSDYTKQDINKDGIGDTPYDINAANKDNYPLMGMFSEFNITLERKTYSVTVISNSTISVFRFQIGAETGNKIIHFNATGEDDTVGFCRAKIPTKLMNYPHIVLVDSEEIIPKVLNVSNESYAYLYFTYPHKNQTITIIYSEALHLYNELLNDYLRLNETYHSLLENYNVLLSNYTQLRISFGELNDSYLKHLLDYSEQMQNIRNLTYILAALTAIFIIATIYLSKRVHARITAKSKEFESE